MGELSSEEKVLKEINEKLTLLFSKIVELKVTREEREEFERHKDRYKELIKDYKVHKEALLRREAELDGKT